MTFIPLSYLTSYFLSLLGNSIASIALPLVVLQTTGSVLGMGVVAGATAVPAVLAGLVMGVVIDRINRRTSSVVTDLVSGLSIAALPLIDIVSGLSIGWFVLLGILGSLGDVPGMTARDALLPAIVRHGSLSAERLMGIRETLGAVAMLVGPAAAGTLMALFGGAAVLWITGATSLLAALVTLLIPHSVGAIPAERTRSSNAWSEMRDGWRVLFRTPLLVATTLLSVASVAVLVALQGLILPVYFSLLDQRGLLGFVLTALAAGLLVGGAVYAVGSTRGRRRFWFVSGLVGTMLGIGILATLSTVWIVFSGAFIIGLASGLFSSLIGVLMIERIPEQMRGRVMGTQNSIMTAVPPLALVAAAVLTEYTTLNVAAIAIAGIWLVALVGGLFARSLRNLEPRAEPTEREDVVVARDAQ
ncbi:MFS transporter [Oerskovia enterophila]|uniref:Multidrug efflux pump Tap n=1 Tax=Oerskovia enterophila TaxID=43678 RepID=A0ABX2Y8M2_9CELL|nr:MFS transporter [Oerskovia enterophila]OCI32869.1 putative multidrug-efflux transporterc [Oerskovia enterophila]